MHRSSCTRTIAMSRRCPAGLFFALIALFAFACDDDTPNDTVPDGGDTDTDTGAFGPASFDDVEVTWTPCSLHEGEDDALAECATVAMPLFWDEHDGRTFEVRAKRLLSTNESTAQLWLLHGGPGASGVIDFPPWMEQLAAVHPTFDVYTLDPRGTGYSEYAECPYQEAVSSAGGPEILPEEVPDCAAYLEDEWGDRLSTVGTTAAAMDLALLIHHTRKDDARVLIWGGSGGTFWANRYLLMFPDGADGVVLEGIEPANGSIAFQDEFADFAVREILAECENDTVCGDKLPDPVQALEDLYAALDDGWCPIGLDSTMLALVLDNFAYYHPLHVLIPSFVYRLARCDDADVDALVQLFGVVFPQPTGDEEPLPSMSTVLFYNEMCSEIWDHASFEDNEALVSYLEAVDAASIVPTGKGLTRNEICNAWPKYEDARDDQFAVADVPLLMLQGMLDPATPHAFAVELADRYDGPNQTFVSMPGAPHNVLGGSPTEDGDCGSALFDAFLEDPQASLDTSCVEEVEPLDFEHAFGLDAVVYGTADCFENEPALGPLTPLAPVLRARLAEVGRRLWTTP